MMKRMFQHGWLAGLLYLPKLAWALPLHEGVDTGLIGGGAMLFVAGLAMLVLPRMFRPGVMIMLVADLLFVIRILFGSRVEQWLVTAGFAPWIDGLSQDAARLLALGMVIGLLLGMLVLVWGWRQLFTGTRVGTRVSSRRPPLLAEEGQADDDALPAPTARARHRGRNNRFRVHDYLEQQEQARRGRDDWR